jgi:N-acetylglucosaminyl-diphospho-decaprenol L-rhamnosyltransferase
VRDLSIVVPTHDTRELTLCCLASLVPLAEAGAEVVLVDDGSRDGTGDAVRAAHGFVRILRNEEAQGFSRAANRGLSAARGRLLLLLNSDTEIDASVRHALEAFPADDRLGAAGASLVGPDGAPQWSGGRLPTRAWLVAMASGLPALLGALPGYRRLRPPGAAGADAEWVTGAALVIRRAAWEELGPLSETFAFYGQDLDFCQRLRDRGWRVRLLAGWRVVHVGGATIGRRPGSISGVQLALLWSDLLLWARGHHGAAWAARTARLMAAAVTLRLWARALARPFAPDRERWDRDSAALRSARETLSPS